MWQVRRMLAHQVRCHLRDFEALQGGAPSIDLLDRDNLRVGDFVQFNEFDEERSSYTFRTIFRRIVGLTRGEGFCTVSLADIDQSPGAATTNIS
jgi:hypothetical protein